MLSQVSLWTERIGMVLDVILMVRLLALKLHRTYLFIALFALLSLFYDALGLYMGTRSDDFARVVIMSRFVYAVVFPLAIWDLFEEAKPIVETLRKLAMKRMISSLIFISLWGLLIAAFTGGEDTDQSHYLLRLAFVIWTGSVAAALAFLFVMKRGIRANDWQLPKNTTVWYRYFQLLLIIEAVSCALDLLLPSVKELRTSWAEPLSVMSGSLFQACEILLTCWCVLKLRSAPSDGANVPAKVNI